MIQYKDNKENKFNYHVNMTNPFAFFYDITTHTITEFNPMSINAFIPENELVSGQSYLEMKVELIHKVLPAYVHQKTVDEYTKDLTVYFRLTPFLFADETVDETKIRTCFYDEWIENKEFHPTQFDRYKPKSLRIIKKE